MINDFLDLNEQEKTPSNLSNQPINLGNADYGIDQKEAMNLAPEMALSGKRIEETKNIDELFKADENVETDIPTLKNKFSVNPEEMGMI